MRIRLIAAAAVLVSAGVHLKLWFGGVRHEHMVGPAFMLNAIGGIVIAILLLTWKNWLAPFLAAGFGVATLGAFIIAATAGLYGDHEHWSGSYVWAAAIAEAIAILAGGIALLGEGGLRSLHLPAGHSVRRHAHAG